MRRQVNPTRRLRSTGSALRKRSKDCQPVVVNSSNARGQLLPEAVRGWFVGGDAETMCPSDSDAARATGSLEFKIEPIQLCHALVVRGRVLSVISVLWESGMISAVETAGCPVIVPELAMALTRDARRR